jgi:GNAT superfamily N-acetyltransferase
MSVADDVTIREANAADLPAILEMLAQPDLDDGDVLSLTEAEVVFAKMARHPSYRLFVAERAGIVVGSYALLVMENLGHRGALSAVVEQVMVAADQQSAGIGGAMMQRAMADAAAAGCYKLALSSNARRVRAHAFYERLGFAQHGLSFHVLLPTVGASRVG